MMTIRYMKPQIVAYFCNLPALTVRSAPFEFMCCVCGFFHVIIFYFLHPALHSLVEGAALQPIIVIHHNKSKRMGECNENGMNVRGREVQ